MAFWLLIISFVSANNYTDAIASRHLDFWSAKILQYPVLSLLTSFALLILSLLIIRHVYKKWRFSTDLVVLVKSKHLLSKEENDYLIS